MQSCRSMTARVAARERSAPSLMLLWRAACASFVYRSAEPPWKWDKHIAFESGGLLWGRSTQMTDIITGATLISVLPIAWIFLHLRFGSAHVQT